MNSAIEVRGLCKHYRDFSLRDVSFTVPGGSIMGFISPTAQQLDNGTLEPTVNGNGSDWALLSYLGRVNYTYDNKYLLTATIRKY